MSGVPATDTDIVIVGAGIAGASLAAELAPHRSVILLEAEDQPGLHATGRSAAFYAETYGGPGVQPLTTASKALLFAPPDDFTDHPFVSDRGALHIADANSRAALAAFQAEFANSPVPLTPLVSGGARERVGIISEAWNGPAIYEPECRDIDVAALHAAYLGAARRAGAQIRTASALTCARHDGGAWTVETASGDLRASLLVNAAGAWSDPVAERCGVRAIGLQPLRRTMVAADIDAEVDPDWPLIVAADGSFYFKPDGGRLWISPHDEIPDEPGDARPEELDIAVAIDRFEKATTARVTRVETSWAGLRTFAPDRLPIYGFDPDSPAFFWCAGQGGFGIQTAPAAARLCRDLILERPAEAAIDAASYAPQRLR
ncbi:MAG: FAD-binding oxidoreductase [Pacificimonas sp.]|jgi:D-arginine dehydrogenase|nr:FAD-binding oxidoreductase [Pacificimonas sp.]